jgi:alpha-L-fucosidase
MKLSSASLLLAVVAASTFSARADDPLPSTLVPRVIVSTSQEPIAPGPFQPTWQSLEQYRVPEWFRDAKFGIWAHWGPQCQAEDGDWYARNMYMEGSRQYKDHLARYGHPSVAGFKDIIHDWKAEKWDPDRLVALYKRVGAQYFFAMADHHDNFDNWNSKYQPWNSVAIGPRKDLIGGWARAARAQGLPFGVSVHASRAWSWYEPAQGSDKTGPKAGVPYDGKLTKADGRGQWWDGLDPQDLYAQSHKPGSKIEWSWNASKGSSIPDVAYCQKFYNRVADLIKNYHPDLIYFDDNVLPLWPVSNVGLDIAADFYNTNLARTQGKSEGVLFGKMLDEQQRKCLVWDIERGVPSDGKPFAWQTDTCLGNWHYDRALYDHNGYKSVQKVVQMLADIVSKNGNLLLNVPVRGDGSIDDKEERVLQGIAEWMDVNKQAILGSRPWKIFGEGPASAGAALTAQGFNEGKGKAFTSQDIRFTVGKDGALYAIALAWPGSSLTIKSLGSNSGFLNHKIDSVQLLGGAEPVSWKQSADGLEIASIPAAPASGARAAAVFKITAR